MLESESSFTYDIYTAIIDELIDEIESEFIDSGLDQKTTTELKKIWLKRLKNSGAFQIQQTRQQQFQDKRQQNIQMISNLMINPLANQYYQNNQPLFIQNPLTMQQPNIQQIYTQQKFGFDLNSNKFTVKDEHIDKILLPTQNQLHFQQDKQIKREYQSGVQNDKKYVFSNQKQSSTIYKDTEPKIAIELSSSIKDSNLQSKSQRENEFLNAKNKFFNQEIQDLIIQVYFYKMKIELNDEEEDPDFLLFEQKFSGLKNSNDVLSKTTTDIIQKPPKNTKLSVMNSQPHPSKKITNQQLIYEEEQKDQQQDNQRKDTTQIQPIPEESINNSEEALNSEDSVPIISKLDSEEEDEAKDILWGYYEKVSRTKYKWKVQLRDCVLKIGQVEYILGHINGEFDFTQQQ